MSDTATPSLPAWLEEFCSIDEDRPALLRPFTFETPTGVLTCASNGHRLIALAAASDYAPADEKIRAGLHRILDAPVVGLPISLAALRVFVGKHVPDTETCVACHGAGGQPCPDCLMAGELRCDCECGNAHTRECGRCEGTGRAPCRTCLRGWDQRVVVRIGANLYDARYFARPMGALAGTTATFLEVTEKDRLMAHLVSDGWQLAVMGLRPDKETKPVAEIEIAELVEAANV